MNFQKLIPALRDLFGAIPEIGSITIYRHSIRFDTDSDDMLHSLAEKLGAKIEIIKLEQAQNENRSVWWLKAQTKIGDCYVEISGRHHYAEPVIIEPTADLGSIAESISTATFERVSSIDTIEATPPPGSDLANTVNTCPHASVDKGDEFNPDRCRSCFAPVYPQPIATPAPLADADDDMPF